MSRERGLTLIEVLVAMTLLALVMTTVVASMRTLGNTGAALQTVTLRVDQLRSVSGFLRDAIGNAQPLQLPPYAGTEDLDINPNSVMFSGDSSRLAWAAPLVAGVDFGGTHALYLEHSDDNLILRWHPYSADPGEDELPQMSQKVLLRQVRDFEVSYLPEFGEDWQDDWPPDVRLPAAVRLNIRNGDKYLPELVIALHARQ